jgi:membrane protease YdiL (CAAX protease family)
LIDPNDPWSLLQAIVVMVGISPVVEEFLFRGVIQQGLVERMGLLRGITTVALLWTLLRPAPLTGFVRFMMAAVASFALGWALGIVRIATGSILGSVLLSSAWAAIGLASLSFEGRLDLPGMNVEGTHLPWSVTLASLVLVAWAGRALYEEARRRDAEERATRQANVSTR